MVRVLVQQAKMVELQVLLTHCLQQLLPLMVVLVHFAQILLLLERVEQAQHLTAQLEQPQMTTVSLVDTPRRSQAHR
jgi:hypothetical protein